MKHEQLFKLYEEQKLSNDAGISTTGDDDCMREEVSMAEMIDDFRSAFRTCTIKAILWCLAVLVLMAVLFLALYVVGGSHGISEVQSNSSKPRKDVSRFMNFHEMSKYAPLVCVIRFPPRLLFSIWHQSLLVFLAVVAVIPPADSSFLHPQGSIGNHSVCTLAEAPPSVDYCMSLPPSESHFTSGDSEDDVSQESFMSSFAVIPYRLTYQSVHRSWIHTCSIVSSLTWYQRHLFSGSSHFELIDASMGRRPVVKFGLTGALFISIMLIMMSPFALVLCGTVKVCGQSHTFQRVVNVYIRLHKDTVRRVEIVYDQFHTLIVQRVKSWVIQLVLSKYLIFAAALNPPIESSSSAPRLHDFDVSKVSLNDMTHHVSCPCESERTVDNSVKLNEFSSKELPEAYLDPVIFRFGN